jgi:hypothetical protein
MSKNRVADVLKTDEVSSKLERRIKALSDKASRLIERIKNVDPNSASLTPLRGELNRIEAEVARYTRRLHSTRSKRKQLVMRAKDEIEGNTGKYEKWVAVQREATSELRSQVRLLSELRNTPVSFGRVPQEPSTTYKYDVFISHAWEDKVDFVRPLASKLIEIGLRVWYDELSLVVGDSLSRNIDLGLSKSRYGLVVLSSAFFSKPWPQHELAGLIAREMVGEKVILPIWHKVTKDEVMRFSPTLADKVALNSAFLSIDEIASKLSSAIRQTR